MSNSSIWLIDSSLLGADIYFPKKTNMDSPGEEKCFFHYFQSMKNKLCTNLRQNLFHLIVKHSYDKLIKIISFN